MKLRPYKIFTTFLPIVSVFIIVGLLQSLWTMWQRRDIVREQHIAYEQAKAENDRLKQAMEDVNTPEFVERVAREKLGLVQPGDTVILMETLESTAAAISQSREPENASDTSWKAWWELFF